VKTRVGVAELKARFSEYLRLVRRGSAVTVLDRDTPVARLVPMEARESLLQIRHSAEGSRVGSVTLPPALALPEDIVELLKEERGNR
jgi:prevent-host-death family protein